MSRDDEFFTPEDIDEQIDSLAHMDGHVPETTQPAERLVSHLRRSYQKDPQQEFDPLDRAWKRIVAGHQAAQQTSQRKGQLIFMENYQTGQQNSHAPRKKRAPIQRFSVLAAVLFVGLLIGGMALALNISHQGSTPGQKQTQISSGGTPLPLPTPAHLISGGTCTIDTTHPHAQQSQSNLPGLYILSSDQQGDTLYRYDSQTKKVVWSIKFCSNFGSWGTIAQNGMLYLAGWVTLDKNYSNGSVSYLYALNQSDGSAIWGLQFPTKVLPYTKDSPAYGSVPLDLGMIEPPTFVNNVLYIVQRTGVVYAYNATTGSQLWTFDSELNTTSLAKSGGPIDDSNVQVVNGVAYFSMVGRVFALDAKSGTQLWMHDFKNAFQGLAVDNGVVYLTAFVPGYGTVAHPDTYVYAFDAQTGTQKWVSKKLTGYLSAPLAYNGNLIVISYDGIWYTLNPASGALEGQKTLSGSNYTNPVLINGVLYNLSGDASNKSNNMLTVLNADGSTKWSAPVSGEYPVIEEVQGGIIYISGRGSGLYAYSASDGKPLWHYNPQPGGDLTAVTVVA